MRLRAGWFAIGFGWATWVACVGNDPETVPASKGGNGERCFDNGTCIAGLSCVAGQCQPAGGDSSADSGHSSTEPGTDAGNQGPDSGHDAGMCVVPADTLEVQCGSTTCAVAMRCCNVSSSVQCEADYGVCPEADVIWSCETKGDCESGQAQCCIRGTAKPDSACGAGVEEATSVCLLGGGNCDGRVACQIDDECVPPATCQPYEARTKGGFTVLLKVCR
jgi:hypothetical protein